MNCKFSNILMFAAGAAIGSAVTWKLLKTKYEQIVQEEIKSIKEAFDDTLMTNEPDAQQDNSSSECPGQINWDLFEDLEEEDEDPYNGANEYARLVNNVTNEKGGAENMGTKPYVISPYDFGEIDDYSKVSLTYYADGTLEDDEYNIITDVDELIGNDSLLTFGEYEDDSVFVRNEILRTDFEILKDYRTYEEARKTGPVQVDDE